MKKRVFSGIQPTGNIHIGNYLGAIKNWVKSQEEYDNIFCIVDLHAITIPIDPEYLKSKIRELAGLLIAAGISTDKSTLFVQSNVLQHTELAWILNCSIPMGWMQRMTQFKEKSEKQKEFVSVGLFDYPALMAADILLYDTHLVPVGEDQKQHIELTRDVAERFNLLFGNVFVIPEPLIPEAGARIMGLDDPTKKMSKSEENEFHSILLTDSPDIIVKKVKRATTDSSRLIVFDPNRPGVHNLLTIYQCFTGKSKSDIKNHFADKGYKELKEQVAEVIIEGLRPLQKRFGEIMSDPGYLDKILSESADKVRPTAEATMQRVKSCIGLG